MLVSFKTMQNQYEVTFKTMQNHCEGSFKKQYVSNNLRKIINILKGN